MKTFPFSTKVSLARNSKSIFPKTEVASKEDTLKDLRKMLPTQQESLKDPDLVYISANLAVCNQVNLNNAAMTIGTAIEFADSLKMRPLNIEHNRSDVCGVITGVFYSAYGTNLIITKEQASKIRGPVNISITGVLWKVVSEAGEVVSMCDSPDFEMFHDLSLSWEVGFSNYSVAMGSKNLERAQIFAGEEAEKYEDFLTANEGPGFDDEGNEVYLVIDGPCRFLGGGLTFSPASAVKGIVCNKEVKMEEEEDDDDIRVEVSLSEEKPEESEEIAKKDENNCKKDEKSENILSQASKKHVNKLKAMQKITSIAEISERLTEASVDLSTQKAIDSFLTDEFKKAEAANFAKVEEIKAEAESAKLELAQLKDQAEKAELASAALQKKVEELESQAAEDRRQNILESRMVDLTDKYDFSSNKALKSAIVKQIENLNDKGFEDWLADIGEPLLASIDKSKKVDPVVATAALQEATASVTIPNGQDVTKKSGLSVLKTSAIIFTK